MHDSILQSDGDSTPSMAEAIEEKQGGGGGERGLLGWARRNRGKATLIAGIGMACVAAGIITTVAVVGKAAQQEEKMMNGNHPRPNNTQPERDPFDDSARANVHVPPLSEPFRYGQDPIRGVNLGGWLVIEPFITPSLFDQFKPEDRVIDEWGLCEKLGPEEARKQLQHHYETFITEEDFRKMAQMGLNHVRIPTGHWAVQTMEGEPFVPKIAWDYLIKGIQWARKYGLRVMVELHTAPGSQNGWNHSGRYGTVGFLNGTHGEENGNKTLEIVTHMTEFFSKPEWSHVTPIFGVLNEPAIYRINKQRAQQWYRQSYDAIRQGTADKGPMLTYHEGFLGLPSWYGFFTDEHYKRVVLETHTYLIFDDSLVSMNRPDQAAFPCRAWKRDLNHSMHENGPTMVGEFSMATNDCGKYLNGVGLGARYEGTLTEGDTKIAKPVCETCTCKGIDNWRNWTEDYKQFLRQFVERQMDAFEASYGWFFWTYKTEEHINPHWDYLLGWEQGWIPADANNRTFSCKEIL